jgi:hypothetical protein
MLARRKLICTLSQNSFKKMASGADFKRLLLPPLPDTLDPWTKKLKLPEAGFTV